MAGISEVAALMTGNSYNEIVPSELNLKVAVDRKFKIPKEYLNDFVKEDDADNRSKTKKSTRTYSIDDVTITENDIKQYDEWVKDKSIIPGLMKEFKSEDEYADFMSNYRDTHLTIELDPAVMKSNKTFSIAEDEQYSFKIDTDAWQGDEQWLDFDHVIGSLLFSVTFAHLFHLCTTDYAAHMALDSYYNEMPEKVDALAEKFLSDNSHALFSNAILPGLDPIDYLTRLKSFVCAFENQMDGVYEDDSAYKSELDDVINLMTSTLYKLKRLAIEKKSLSFSIKN